MAEVKWIKLMTDMFDNSKIKYIRTLPEGNNIVLIWVMLLAKAGKCNSNGFIFLTENIPYTSEMLAAEFNFEISTINLALITLSKLNMIQMEEQKIEITGWEEYQNIESLEKIRTQTRKRVQKYRENQKKLLGNVTCNVTVTQSNAIEEERRKKNKNKNKKEETTTSSGDDFNIFTYFQQRGFVSISPLMYEDINSLVEMYSLEEVKQAVDIADNNGIHKLTYIKGILERRRAGDKDSGEPRKTSKWNYTIPEARELTEEEKRRAAEELD